ncbi:MAG: glycine oxidase ThiO [Bacteroidia bacterium]|nr:glycine oxidase ThiO [Bacteroidia bacterium]
MLGREVEYAVVGGGAAGLAIAWQLALRGHVPVVFDAKQPGSGAMTASAGMLSPAYEAEFGELHLLQAMIESRRLYPKWAAELGDIGYEATGTYELALMPEDIPYVKRRMEFERSQGLRVEWMEGRELRERLPILSPRIPGGSYAPDEGHVSPELLRDRLVEAAQRKGVVFLSETPVARIERTGRNFLLHTPRGLYQAEVVIVCVGVPVGDLELPFRVYPVRGQMVAVEMPRPGWLPSAVRYLNKAYGYGYAVPKRTYIILGGTVEEKGWDASVTMGGILDILRRAYYVFPDLYEARVIRIWAGLRPATQTRTPLFHKEPESRLYYINGLYRNGILLLPLIGEGVAQWIVEGNLPPVLVPFQVEEEG